MRYKESKNSTRVLFVCERSGGHVFPAVSFARKFLEQDKNFQVLFFVTSKLLQDFLRKQGFGVWGKVFKKRNLVLEFLFRFFEAIYLLAKLNPQKVIGFGGRDSFFLVLFAAWLGKNTVIYEPNVSLGKANKILSLFVTQVWRGFPADAKNSAKSYHAGIPLRGELKRLSKETACAKLGLPSDLPIILCVGGSQGSTFLNTAFLKLLNEITDDFGVIHLTGGRDFQKIFEQYQTQTRKAMVKDFCYDMELVYSAADIIIARSGAATLAEITYYQIPAILIPHPSSNGHQKENALYLQERGAAFIFEQENFAFNEFKETIKLLLTDQELCGQIKQQIAKIPLTKTELVETLI